MSVKTQKFVLKCAGKETASYEDAMKLQKKSSKKKLFDDDSDGEGSDESNTVSKIISKLDSPGKKTKEMKGTPKKVQTDEERVMPKKAPKQEIVTTPCKSPHTKPSSSKLSPELVMLILTGKKFLHLKEIKISTQLSCTKGNH